MKIDIQKIKKLIDSRIPAYTIEKETGVSRATLSNYRTGKADVMKMTLENGLKLSKYQEELEMKDLKIIKLWESIDSYEAEDGKMHFRFEDGETIIGDASNEAIEAWIKDNTDLIPSDYDEWSDRDKAEALSGWYQLHEDEIDFQIFKEALENA